MLFLRCLCELLSDLKKQTRAEATLCSHKLFRLQTKNREKSFLPPTSSTPSRSMSLVKFDIWPVNVDRLPLTWPRDWPRPEPSPPSHDDILADRGRKTHQKVREGGGTGLCYCDPNRIRIRLVMKFGRMFCSVRFSLCPESEWRCQLTRVHLTSPNPANNSCCNRASEAAYAAF